MDTQSTRRRVLEEAKGPTCHKCLAAMLALLALTVSACELDSFFDGFDFDDISDSCSTSLGPRDVEGEWLLTARGSRSGCDEPDFDGEFRISPVRLEIVQSPSDETSNTDELALSEPISRPGVSFSLRGTVRGTCVDFTTEENGTTGFFRFVFDGDFENLAITGQFSGEGPPGCVSSGDFRVTIH